MEEENQEDDFLSELIDAAGFKIVPIQAIIDALAEMENYVKDQTGLTQEELDQMLDKVKEVVGEEEAMTLGLDEIVSWVRAIRGF